MEEYIEFAKRIAREAGKIMNEYFFKDKQTEYKEDRTPVTIADKMINEYLINEVKNHYPTHSVIGEELSYNNGTKYSWVCDPIDGTSMFNRGVSVSVFSLALVCDGEVLLGVVYDPFLDMMYSAVKGMGAYCNDKKISVNNKSMNELGSSIDYCMWSRAKYDTLKVVSEIRAKTKVSSMGSVAHACMLLAIGKINGIIFPGTTHGNCDVAASKIIIEEAGGVTSNFKGEDQRYDEDIDGFIAGNKETYPELKSIIGRIYNE